MPDLRRRQFIGLLGGAAEHGRSRRARSKRRCRWCLPAFTSATTAHTVVVLFSSVDLPERKVCTSDIPCSRRSSS
jgi:hypothetical protein